MRPRASILIERLAQVLNSSKNRLQAGNHGLQMSARFVSILPCRGLHTAVCHSWSAAPAIGWQIGSTCSRNTNCDFWPAGSRGGGPGSSEFSVPCSEITDSLVYLFPERIENLFVQTAATVLERLFCAFCINCALQTLMFLINKLMDMALLSSGLN